MNQQLTLEPAFPQCQLCGSNEVGIFTYHYEEHVEQKGVIAICRRCHTRIHHLGTLLMERRTKDVSLSLPVRLLESVDELVKEGRYASRSAFVTEAVRRLLERELPLAERRRGRK